MLLDAVREFTAISRHVSVKGSDPHVKELMVTLRRGGFSSSEISELSGGKWSSTLVRQYTVGWGGVDEELDNQRKRLMRPLMELASSGRDISDVERVLSLERSVKAKGSSLEEVAELNSSLRNLDLVPGEIGDLIKLSREFLDKQLTPGSVKFWLSLDRELLEAGFNKTNRIQIRNACRKYVGITETLRGVNEFNSLTEIQRKHHLLIEEVERLNSLKEELDATINQNRDMIKAVNIATTLGFNPVSLTMISELSKTLGGPYEVAGAITKYSSVREIDEELKAKKAMLEKMNRETSDKSLFINAINNTLNESKKAYEKSSDVRQVVELLVNPRGIRMNRSELVRLLTRVLDNSIQKIEENPPTPLLTDPTWDIIYESLKSLAYRLHQFSE